MPKQQAMPIIYEKFEKDETARHAVDHIIMANLDTKVQLHWLEH